jgi:2-keto-4-pentenoate hydratase
MQTQKIAELIKVARNHGTPLSSAKVPISAEAAYDIQWINTRQRIDAGDQIVGWKLGYVSQVMRAAMGISEPNYAPLFANSIISSGADLPERSIAPRVEPEIAVVLDQDLVSASYWLSLEIVDSVWKDYDFTWAHNTADHSSSSFAVIGPKLGDGITQKELLHSMDTLEFGFADDKHERWDPHSCDLDIQSSIHWLQNELNNAPHKLQPGDIILTGGLCAPIRLGPGESLECVVTMKDSWVALDSNSLRVEISRER